MTEHELTDKNGLKRELGVWSAAAIVVGTVIGSGIFLVPSTMARNVGSPLKVFGVWIAGGLLSLFGALSYAELAAAMPEAGGEYVYLREAYGPLWGFLYGWTQMWVAKSGSIATLATGFYIYLANFRPELGKVWMVVPLPLGEGGSPLPIRYGQLLAIAVIILLALINYFGVRVGGNVQVATTLLKVGLIGAIIVIGLGSGLGSVANYHSSTPAPGGILGFFAALVGALWAYDGWNNVTMVASEVRKPQRNLPLALIVGTFGSDRDLSADQSRLFLRPACRRGGIHGSRSVRNDAQDLGRARRGGRQSGGHDFDFRRAQWLHSLRLARAFCHGAGRIILPRRGTDSSRSSNP